MAKHIYGVRDPLPGGRWRGTAVFFFELSDFGGDILDGGGNPVVFWDPGAVPGRIAQYVPQAILDAIGAGTAGFAVYDITQRHTEVLADVQTVLQAEFDPHVTVVVADARDQAAKTGDYDDNEFNLQF
jgi:hypothetical protein